MPDVQSLDQPARREHQMVAVRLCDPQISARSRNHIFHVRRVERVIGYMSSCLEEPLTNEQMAAIACLSPCHFNRVFRNVTGIPPIQFHYALRLQRAKHLLIATERLITEICFDVGYNSLGTFVTRFNRLVGLPPNAFRRLARRLATVPLSDLNPYLRQAEGIRRRGPAITGIVEPPFSCDGLTFTALFPRAIPEGMPVACTFGSTGGAFVLPTPGNGEWRIMSVSVPWSTTGAEMLTLDGLARGRSGPITVKDHRWTGDSTIALAAPSLLDPPILAALPIFINRMVAAMSRPAERPSTSRWQHAAIA
jgi:AraC-like DNA-binding protein